MNYPKGNSFIIGNLRKESGFKTLDLPTCIKYSSEFHDNITFLRQSNR